MTDVGIPEIDIKLAVEFAPVDKLKLTTVCCCIAQSFFLEWPDLCGVQQEVQCICFETAVSLKCLQFGDATKTCSKSVSLSKCIDLTSGDFVCLESKYKFIYCFCITGAVTQWCGFDNLKPCATKGNCLCCDFRCGLPPSDETVPFGIACCGFPLYPKDYKFGSMS
ncbi:hypothetical protein AAMO2058_000708400 [Amorphochlora amoebiformis]|eukprot:784228-Amorphochlora_amoeboformis.AAC.3